MDQADCWHRVCGRENQVALQEHLQVWLRLSKPCWSLDLGVPRSSQTLWPVTALPKLELICGIRCSSLSWLSGMQASADCRIKACSGHKHTALCHLAIPLVSPARVNSTHISQANSGPRSSPCSASYEIITCRGFYPKLQGLFWQRDRWNKNLIIRQCLEG